MSYSRPIPSHLRSQSMGPPSTGQSPALLARIEEKKAELAHLKELQALSAGLADQMQMLEQKLSTLSDGTEAVATVLSNWHHVLRTISMASSKLAKPKDDDTKRDDAEVPLPQTLVRIPTQHAGLIAQTTSGSNDE
ncbi:hypothetical protein EJ06DRAFT_557601 [Trichodelitschia bisporula]|uniref:DASH complex subunit DAD2 n=1 Tax=Trichodelitschia bisporula TaxID=703511 RepID=A0A6G1HTB2_9PEZI|nr:hypothetical protein EJ06DRAFT_557601 [Trichodelitschia bisporula]